MPSSSPDTFTLIASIHIGIIFQLFIFLLGGRKYSVYTIILSFISIWTYVFLIGLPASAVRAAIMLSAYSLSLAFHRTGLPLNTLASAYIFMLFISPLYLFELSFQLSFLAVYFYIISRQNLLLHKMYYFA